jgi:hypothetical protein
MSTLEKIERMEQDIVIAVQASQRALGTQEIVAQRILGFEQASASLGKIVSALTKVLIDTGVTTDSQIYKAILKVEEEQDRREVEVLLSHNVVEAVDTVSEKSVVVVSQEVVGEPESKIDYRLHKIMDGSAPEAFVQDILGRKVGETLQINMAEDKVLLVVVKEIYSLKEVEA